MSSKDIFDDIIQYLNITLIDETSTIQRQIESMGSRFVSLEAYDNIDQIDNLNTTVVLANITNEEIEKKVLSLATIYKDSTFTMISKNQQKDLKLPNIQYISNLKTIDNKLLKIYKNKYMQENLTLRFSNDSYYNVTQKKLYDKDSNEIHLTQRELDLLMLLLKNTNTVVLHKTIQSKIWHESYEVSDSAYKSLLNKLRGKIGKKSIKSISRKGYVINFE